MWQNIRVVLTGLAGFGGLLIAYLIIESDRRLILAHHLDQTVVQALWRAFGHWGGGAVFIFLFVVAPGLLLASVLFDDRQRWREVIRWIPIPMDEWLPPNRSSS